MWITIIAVVTILSSIVTQAQLQNTNESKIKYGDNYIVQKEHELQNKNNSKQVANNGRNINLPMLFGDIIANNMKNFIPFSHSNKNCTRNGQEFTVNLNNQTLWAVRMYDSSAKYPGGILSGEVTELGIFDQCMSVSSKPLNINGAYAVANIRFRRINEDPPVELHDFVQADRERSKRDLLGVGPEYIWWALCFPDSCTNEDVRLSVEHVLIPAYRAYNIVVEVTIPQSTYTTKNTTMEYTKGVLLIYTILIMSFTLMVTGTLYDIAADHSKSETRNFLTKCLCSYSIITNTKNLMQDPKSGELVISNLLKTMAIISVVVGHRLALDLVIPKFNPEFTEHIYTEVWWSVLKSPVIVEVFFIVSGFFTYIVIEKRLRNGKPLKFLFLLSYRLMRILPTYITVILIFAFILPYMGDGPLWRLIIYPEAEYCRKNWWTNVLFINNYVNTKEMCMLHTWYLACDIHYFIIGTFLTYIICKWKKAGIGIFSILFALSIYIPAKSIYDNKQWGVMPYFHSTTKNIRAIEHFQNIYIKSHHRMTTYLIGLAAAYVYLSMNKSNFKFSVKSKAVGFLICFLLHVACFFVNGYFYLPNITYNPWFHLLYFTLQRIVYSLTIAYFLVVGSLSNFGVINGLCGNKLFAVIARITYVLFLAHFIVQLQSIGQIRQPQYGNIWTLYWKINADFTTALAYSLPLYLIVEAPTRQIFNHVLRIFLKEEHNKLESNEKNGTSVQRENSFAL